MEGLAVVGFVQTCLTSCQLASLAPVQFPLISLPLIGEEFVTCLIIYGGLRPMEHTILHTRIVERLHRRRLSRQLRKYTGLSDTYLAQCHP